MQIESSYELRRERGKPLGVKAVYTGACFCLLAMLLWRQPILNALGVDRALMSGLHALVLTLFGVIIYFSTITSWPRSLIKVPVVTIALNTVCIFLLIAFYVSSLSAAQASVGFLVYAVAPLFFFLPLFLCRYPIFGDAALLCVQLIFLFSALVAIAQFENVQLGAIFATDDSVVTKQTFYGVVRVNGLYGNFVDFACVAFLAAAYFGCRMRKHFDFLCLTLHLLGVYCVFLTSTRAYIFLLPVIYFFMLPPLRLKVIVPSLVVVLSVLAVGAAIINASDAFLIQAYLDLFLSQDKHTIESNFVRLEQFNKFWEWINEYTFTGVGPGFLLGPNEAKRLYVRDGMFFMLMLELGAIFAAVLFLSLFIPMVRASFSHFLSLGDSVGKRVFLITFISWFVTLPINSAFALPTTACLIFAIFGWGWWIYKRAML